jgi:hypothetical protein
MCFKTTHREAGHGTICLVGESTKVSIHIRNQFVEEHCLKRLNIEAPETAPSARPYHISHSIRHYDDKGIRLALGYQIVHNQVGMSLVCPSGFVLSPAML